VEDFVCAGGNDLMPQNSGIVKLLYREKGFSQDSGDSDIVLLVDQQAKKLILKSSPGANFIDVRTAERQARSFPKIGIPLKNGENVGRGFEFVVENEIGPPEKLRHSPRQVYMGPSREP
jgi:hypothetical protein